MTDQKLVPPHLRRKPEAQKRYPSPPPPIKRFIPIVGMELRLDNQIWTVAEVKTRGRWKASYAGEEDPAFKPETGQGLNFNEPGRIQEIYQAKKRSFWAKPLIIKGRGQRN